jgi:hypothetical protein
MTPPEKSKSGEFATPRTGPMCISLETIGTTHFWGIPFNAQGAWRTGLY